jgi:hypothetical protein
MLATLAIAPLVRQFEEIANRVDQTAAVPHLLSDVTLHVMATSDSKER